MSNLPKSYIDWRDNLTHSYKLLEPVTLTPEMAARELQQAVEREAQEKFNDAVGVLAFSVTAFHERYGTATRENAVENQAKAFAQEAGEFVWKVAAGDLDGAEKEAADVLFTLIGVATLAGITREALAEAMRTIAASNDNKTVEKGWNWNARGTKVEKLTTGNGDAGSA